MPVLVKPRFVRLRGVVGDEIEQTVQIEGQKDEPLIVELSSNSIPDKTKAELKEVKKGRRYLLTIKNSVRREKNYI